MNRCFCYECEECIDRINRYVDQSPRKLFDGREKDTLTGIVDLPSSRHMDDFDRQLPKNNQGF